jgi:hypothetical protein
LPEEAKITVVFPRWPPKSLTATRETNYEPDEIHFLQVMRQIIESGS